MPEFDRFGLFAWDAALTRVGKNLARVLAAIRPVVPEAAIPAPGRSPPARP